jgi:hypothetical protein
LKDSAFSFDQYVCPQTQTPITRYFNPTTEAQTIYSHSKVAEVLSMSTYSSFSKELNELHGGVHWYVGKEQYENSNIWGTMAAIPQAPQGEFGVKD